MVQGNCQVDEAMITGESMLISKQKDSVVIGGTILQSGMAHVRATHVGKDASLARIVQLMEQAQMSKAPIQRIAGEPAVFCDPSKAWIYLRFCRVQMPDLSISEQPSPWLAPLS